MAWRFPKVRFVEENTAIQQADHVLSEGFEVDSELIRILSGIDDGIPEDYSFIDEEMADLLHSAETYFRIRQKEGLDISSVFASVIEKNKSRGYYGEGK